MDVSVQINSELHPQPVSERMLHLSATDQEGVKQSIDSLTAEFEASQGRRIGEALSGSLDVASNAHEFLFLDALQTEDPTQRRISHLAHLQLDLTHNTASHRIKSVYSEQLGKTGIPLAQLYPGLFFHEGNIRSGSELPKGHQGQTLIVEKGDLSEEYINYAESYEDFYRKFESVQIPDGKSREEAALLVAAQQTILTYFGIPDEHTGRENKRKYDTKQKRSLDEFKGDRTATCTEMGVLAQELLSFSGMKSVLISGGPLLVANSHGEYDAAEIGGHVFNIIFLGEGKDRPYLFDPSNYLSVPSSSDATQMQIRPYCAPLSAEQFGALQKGGNMELEYGGEKRLYSVV